MGTLNKEKREFTKTQEQPVKPSSRRGKTKLQKSIAQLWNGNLICYKYYQFLMGQNVQRVGDINLSEAVNIGTGIQPLSHKVSTKQIAKAGVVWQGSDCLFYPVLSCEEPVN